MTQLPDSHTWKTEKPSLTDVTAEIIPPTPENAGFINCTASERKNAVQAK